MHAGQLGRTLNLFLRRARIPQRNIVGHAVREQEWRLTHHRQSRTPVVELHLGQRQSLIANLTIIHIKLALDQRQ
ncbi:hypothetical protein D3C85_1718870 [compost metagenome]